MAIRELIFYGNPILHHKAKKIHHFDATLPKLVQDMFETMHANAILYLDRLDRPEDLHEVRPNDPTEEAVLAE